MGKFDVKNIFDKKESKKTFLLLLMLIFISFGGTLIIALYDREISAFFVNLGETNTFIYNISVFFDRSLFDGDGWGGQDLSFILTLIVLVLYFIAYIPVLGESLKLKPHRKYLGFFISCGLLLTIINRGLKALVARVRPYDVVEDSSLYTPIWKIGNYSFADGLSEGSFTSGHTNAAVFLIIIAFILIKTHKTWLISLGFVLTIGYSILMAISRVVLEKHYLTDGLYAIIIGIAIIGLMYFFLFDIPAQESGEKEVYSKMEDFRFGVLSSLSATTIFAILVCMKLFLSNFLWWYIVVIIIGPIVAYFIQKRIKFILK
ncbi:MAG: phosphatase PAP2 family protein [Promethearchaeota archaeon]